MSVAAWLGAGLGQLVVSHVWTGTSELKKVVGPNPHFQQFVQAHKLAVGSRPFLTPDDTLLPSVGELQTKTTAHVAIVVRSQEPLPNPRMPPARVYWSS